MLYRTLTQKFEAGLLTNYSNRYFGNHEALAYIKYEYNMKLITELITHENRDAVGKYIDLSIEQPGELARKDPLLAEKYVGVLTAELYPLFINTETDQYSIQHVREAARSMLAIEYASVYPKPSEHIVSLFVPMALYRFFGFSYEEYINAYEKRDFLEPFLHPPILKQ